MVLPSWSKLCLSTEPYLNMQRNKLYEKFDSESLKNLYFLYRKLKYSYSDWIACIDFEVLQFIDHHHQPFSPFVSNKITLSQCQINTEQKREQLSNLSNTSNNLITVILNWKICTQKKGGENERELIPGRKLGVSECVESWWYW